MQIAHSWSNFHSSGGIDNSLLEKNLDTAANIYIDKCNGAPFQESRIILYKGNKDELARKYQERRPHLETFLKGSQVRKQELRVENPTLYDYFEEIWNIQERHMVKGLPKNYIFQLLPCYQNGCPHPVCLSGKLLEEKCWYEDGPPLSYLYLIPVVSGMAQLARHVKVTALVTFYHQMNICNIITSIKKSIS